MRRCGILKCLACLTLLVVGCPCLGFSQHDVSFYHRTPNTRDVVRGTDTVRGFELSQDALQVRALDSGATLLRLPLLNRKAPPDLLGMIAHDDQVEVFLGWEVEEVPTGRIQSHIEVFRGRRGAEAALVHDFMFFGVHARVSFFEPPDARHAPVALIDIAGGASWTTTYLLSPDRASAHELFASSNWEFADPDRDGVYELIAWNRRPFDVRCEFGIFAVRFYPEVFVRSGENYRKVWPPPKWAEPWDDLESKFKNHQLDARLQGANLQIVGVFADLDGDGASELIVLQDRLREEPEQSLAIYRLERNQFSPLAQAPLPAQSIAFLISGIRDSKEGKRVLIQTATPTKCKDSGNPDGSGTSEAEYLFRQGRLELVQSAPRP